MKTNALIVLSIAAGCSPGNPEIDETGDTTEWIFDCEGDNDAVIDADELPWGTGVSVPYLANHEGTTVSVQPQGSLAVELDLVDPAGLWFAEHFPSASYAAPLFAHDLDLLGVIEADDAGFALLGLASREESPAEGQTLVVYDEPVDTYTFPLELGSSWSAETSFRDALIQGVANAGDESYLFEVDALGTVLLPGFELENVLRVRVEVSQSFTVSTGDNPVESIRYVYLRECFGELARITSQSGETDPGFEEASEVRVMDVEG